MAVDEQFKKLGPQPQSETQLQMGRAVYWFGLESREVHRPCDSPFQNSTAKRRQEGMVSTENKQMAQFFASMTERMSRTDLDLATIRDVYENLHLAAGEPECVCYAEEDIDGVPALWVCAH